MSTVSLFIGYIFSDKSKVHDERGSHDGILEKLRVYQDRFSHLTNDIDAANTVREDTGDERSRLQETALPKTGIRPEKVRDSGHAELQDDAKKDPPGQVKAATSKDSQKSVDANQLAATRTSLDHTITVSNS